MQDSAAALRSKMADFMMKGDKAFVFTTIRKFKHNRKRLGSTGLRYQSFSSII